jgi:glycosyltransferase involved in cell wall biosynthesis
MRVLHVSKTSDGALWAVRQVSELVRMGVEVHVALPDATGRATPEWQATGAALHIVDCALPVFDPAKFVETGFRIRELVRHIGPDFIHSHHVNTTAMLRLSLGKKHPIPRIFQVPGPLHLEHWPSRTFEISLAGDRDYWVGSSRFINLLYARAGVPADRIFLSYHSAETKLFSGHRTEYLRRKLGIPYDATVIGNINLIYPPKKLLGQKVGVKCHEDVIEAIGLVRRVRKDVWGVLVGGTFQNSDTYETKLRTLAKEKGEGRILMPGYFSPEEVGWSWPDFDCAVHVPLSENCGGVTEPLLCRVPTIASEIGGLPEVVMPGLTGELVPVRNPGQLAVAVLKVLRNPADHKRMAERGRQLVSTMFDPARCASEVLSIYRHLLFREPIPVEFDARQFLESDTGPTFTMAGMQSAAVADGAESLAF